MPTNDSPAGLPSREAVGLAGGWGSLGWSPLHAGGRGGLGILRARAQRSSRATCRADERLSAPGGRCGRLAAGSAIGTLRHHRVGPAMSLLMTRWDWSDADMVARLVQPPKA